MSYWLWLAVLGSTVLCVCACVWKRGRRARRMLAGLAGKPPLPIVGNALEINGDPECLMNFCIQVGKEIEEKGLPYVFWMGPYPCIFLSDPEDIRTVNNASIHKPHFYKLAGAFVGEGLITADAQVWKNHIKKLGSTLNTSVVEGYQELFNDLVQSLIVKLKAEKTRDYAKFREHLSFSCLQAICQTTMGIPSDMLDRVIDPACLKSISNGLTMLVNRAGNLLYHVDAIFAFTALYKEMMKCKDLLHGVCAKMIERRRAERKEQSNKTENFSKRYLPLIDVLLDMQQEEPTATDDYLKNEMLTFVVAGHDTVSVSITCTLLLLGTHPEAQKKTFEEIRSLIPDPTQPISKFDLSRMEYLNAVVKESLRLFPPVPVIFRALDRDLELTQCTIPAGTCCLNILHAANRLKSYWGEDANEFRPERWFEKNAESNPAFIPFSTGRRPCVGQRYALPVVKTYVAYLVRSLEFEADISKMSIGLEISIKPRNCKLTYRERED